MSERTFRKLFTNPLAQNIFSWIHPDIGIGLADYFSSKSREAQDAVQEFLGPDKEWLIQYAEKMRSEKHIDYFVFGHRHLPIDYTLLDGKSRYINLGDWLTFQSYAKLKNGMLQICFYKNEHGQIFP